MTINGSLLVSIPIVKPFSAENFCPTKIGPENDGFSRKWGSKYHFLSFSTPKRHILAWDRVFWRSLFCVKISFRVWAVDSLKNQKTNILGVIFHPYGEKKTLVGSAQNFAQGRYPRRNHRYKFGGRSVVRGQILGFSIGFRRRPYNTLALPCECWYLYLCVQIEKQMKKKGHASVCLSVCLYVCVSVCVDRDVNEEEGTRVCMEWASWLHLHLSE